jgi:hypothetical protein
MSETMMTPKLNAALAKAQAKFDAAEKNSLNPAFKDPLQPAKAKGTKYADLTSIIEATRPALVENELAVSQEMMDAPEGWVKVRTCLLHSSGEERTSILSMPVAQRTPQGYGSTISYTRRYGYTAMVGAVTSDDDDGNAGSGKETKANPAKKDAPIPPPPMAGDELDREKVALVRLAAEAKTKADIEILRPRFNALPKQDQDEVGPVLTKRKGEVP